MRYQEILESELVVPYVVIVNYGRGQQAMWPSSKEPGAYSQVEAQAIVDEQTAKQTPFNGRPGAGNGYWMCRPITEALKYVAMGNECYYGLCELIRECGFGVEMDNGDLN